MYKMYFWNRKTWTKQEIVEFQDEVFSRTVSGDLFFRPKLSPCYFFSWAIVQIVREKSARVNRGEKVPSLSSLVKELKKKRINNIDAQKI